MLETIAQIVDMNFFAVFSEPFFIFFDYVLICFGVFVCQKDRTGDRNFLLRKLYKCGNWKDSLMIKIRVGLRSLPVNSRVFSR